MSWSPDYMTFQFHNRSYDNDCGTIARNEWDFGDPASGSANTSTDEEGSHTFSSPGIYTVTLTVTDSDDGLTNSYAISVQAGS